MTVDTLIALMRDGAVLSCLCEYTLEVNDTTAEMPTPRVVDQAIKSGRIEQVCDNGSIILRFQLKEDNE